MKKSELLWGEPWNFLFNTELDEEERQQKMNTIAANLYTYVETSLGGPQFFTLQITWSFSPAASNLYQMYADLIVNQAGVVSWQKINEKKIKEDNLRHQTEATLGIGGDRTGELSLGGSKSPPPPPPPPIIEIMGMEPPFRLLNDIFEYSHMLEFNAKGEVRKFNEALKTAGGAIA